MKPAGLAVWLEQQVGVTGNDHDRQPNLGVTLAEDLKTVVQTSVVSRTGPNLFRSGP